MSWAEREHRKLQKERQRKKDILFDGQVFYDVCVLGMWRTLQKRGLSADEAEEIIDESIKEMYAIYEIPGDYHGMCVEETGIEVVME